MLDRGAVLTGMTCMYKLPRELLMSNQNAMICNLRLETLFLLKHDLDFHKFILVFFIRSLYSKTSRSAVALGAFGGSPVFVD